MSEAASPMTQADINTLSTMASCGAPPVTPLKVKRKAKESNDEDIPDDGIVTPPRPQAAQPQPTPQTKPKPKRAKNSGTFDCMLGPAAMLGGGTQQIPLPNSNLTLRKLPRISAAASEPVQIRNGKLAVKQKQLDFTNEMSVLSGASHVRTCTAHMLRYSS